MKLNRTLSIVSQWVSGTGHLLPGQPVNKALVLLVVTALIFSLSGPGFTSAMAAPARPAYTAVTTIVVNSTSDPDVNDSRTCLTHTPCTLRRAVIQSRGLPAAQKPVLIAFDIPTTDPGYNSALGVWKITFSGYSSAANSTLRYLTGNTIIDGRTQPGGRTNGPKIILYGPLTGTKDGMKLGETSTQNNNEIYGLAFQNFATHIHLNSNNNKIEDNWFGLNDTGTAPLLRNGNPQDGSGSTGISVSDGSSGNTIQNNVFLGLDGVAAAIRGSSNQFVDNFVGTAADGGVPGKVSDPDLLCSTDDWLGGGGISIEGVIYSGTNHHIAGNIFAGLRQEIFSLSTQPDAIRVSGTRHLIENNKIGVDSKNAEVGVCGRGIFLSGSPHDMEVKNNRIVESRLSAISLNDPLYDAVLLRGNTIKKSSGWPSVEGNPKAEDAIQLGTSLPDPLEKFVPARVTKIAGTAVSGTSGQGSPCANCVIEVFLDDSDSVVEALQSLAVVTADANGNWSAVLPAKLPAGHGLRTTSTTSKFNTIQNISANTTSGLSQLYLPQSFLYIPEVLK